MEVPTQIALFPAPGKGHLIPFIELGRKLLQLHTLSSITILIPHDGFSTEPLKPLLQTAPDINFVFLAPSTAHDLPSNAKIEDRIVCSVTNAIPSLCKTLTELKQSSRVSALIVDNFGVAAAIDAVKELCIPVYLFSLCSALVMSFALHLPHLEESCQNTEFPELVQLPNSVTVHRSDLPDLIQQRGSHTYRECVEICRKYASVDGILVNSFLDLEPDTFEGLEQGSWPPVYPIGPLVRPGSADDMADCLKWLDEQPVSSVLFVSFGSGGTLSSGQLKELALGLEMSDQRFVFVAREPNDEVKNAAYFATTEVKMEPDLYLPSGFVERTKGKGLVLSHWGPQIEILSHPAVGGFLTHCGWNSTLESIVHGVPLIAWPLFAEQRMNAVLLSEDLKVALRVRENENGVVDSEQITVLVTRLIKEEVGQEIRIRMRNLKEAAQSALTRDGSSTKSLAVVVEKWK